MSVFSAARNKESAKNEDALRTYEEKDVLEERHAIVLEFTRVFVKAAASVKIFHGVRLKEEQPSLCMLHRAVMQ